MSPCRKEAQGAPGAEAAAEEPQDRQKGAAGTDPRVWWTLRHARFAQHLWLIPAHVQSQPVRSGQQRTLGIR